MKRLSGLIDGVFLSLAAAGLATAAEPDVVELVAGEPATPAILVPFSTGFDGAGNLYGIEFQDGNRFFKIDTAGQFSFLGGKLSQTSGKDGDISEGDGGPVSGAVFNGVHDIAVTPEGDVYLADTWNNRIRKVDGKTGIITTFAGTGVAGFSGDGGPATEAKLGGIYSCALNKDATRLYLADLPNLRIRVIDLSTGIIETVVGSGEKGLPEDGTPALEAPLINPRAVTVDDDENIYILSRNGHALRVVEAKTGKIKTVVNASGAKGATGDGGDALLATMNGPKHLCMAPNGDVIIADAENHLIRRYVPGEGKIYHVAGVPEKKGTAGIGGPPSEVQLNRPHGVRIGPDGLLYVSDSYNNRVLRFRLTD